MSRSTLCSLVVAGMSSLCAASCEAPEPEPLHARDKVLPFIPVCTACIMWTFGDRRWAVHRSSSSSFVEGEMPPAPIELLAVRQIGSTLWLHTADAQTFTLGSYRVYLWPPHHLETELLEAEEAEAATPRNAEFWIREVGENGGDGLCTVPWLGGAPLPGEKELDHWVAALGIEQQICDDV